MLNTWDMSLSKLVKIIAHRSKWGSYWRITHLLESEKYYINSHHTKSSFNFFVEYTFKQLYTIIQTIQIFILEEVHHDFFIKCLRVIDNIQFLLTDLWRSFQDALSNRNVSLMMMNLWRQVLVTSPRSADRRDCWVFKQYIFFFFKWDAAPHQQG